jgi:hypothetical protein
MKRFKHLTVILLGASAVLGLLSSCSKSPTSPATSEGKIKLSIKGVTRPAAGTLGKAASFITITSAKVVIKEIEFESSSKDSVDFEMKEPFVQDLATDTTVHVLGSTQVPFGIYKEMEIEVEKLEPEDGDAYTQNPDLQNWSIRVEGYLNGDTTKTFVFTSDISVEQEQEFNPPLVIDQTSPSTNVVLVIDVGSWFLDANNNPIDPTVPENRSLIEKNIKASFKVFEDEDDDGKEDDDD